MADFKENSFRVERQESAENGNNCRRRNDRYGKEPWESTRKQWKKAFSTILTAKNENFRKTSEALPSQTVTAYLGRIIF
jgi:hypothetical protein